MNQGEREDIERFEKIQDNTSEIRAREIKRLLQQLKKEIDTERWDKIVKDIRYHKYEQ